MTQVSDVWPTPTSSKRLIGMPCASASSTSRCPPPSCRNRAPLSSPLPRVMNRTICLPRKKCSRQFRERRQSMGNAPGSFEKCSRQFRERRQSMGRECSQQFRESRCSRQFREREILRAQCEQGRRAREGLSSINEKKCGGVQGRKREGMKDRCRNTCFNYTDNTSQNGGTIATPFKSLYSN